MTTLVHEKPYVYSCSGCSSAAQMSNYLAVQLDRHGVAEMSCIAGVGGNVKKILRTARSGRKTIAIDGCSLACSKACLSNHALTPDLHIELTALGVRKKNHEDFNKNEADAILQKVELLISKKVLQNLPDRKPGFISENKDKIIVREVLNKNQQKEFIELPYRLYKNSRYYVPHLKSEMETIFSKTKNPAFQFCEAKQWLACKDDRVVGRIAGIINHSYIKKWGKNNMQFGWVEFEDDEEIAKALLGQVEGWAKERGLTAVHGPLGFTNFDPAGLLIRGFNELGTFATIYNHTYYPLHIERAGYGKDVDWVEYRIKVPGKLPEKLEKIASVVKKRYQLSVVKADTRKKILPYAKDIFKLINSAYADLYGTVAMNEKGVEYYSKKYMSYIHPEYVSIVLDKDGELAAFGITMPSVSLAMQKAKGHLYPFGFMHILKAFRKNNLVDMCLVAVRKDLQGKGVNAILMLELNKVYIEKGIKYAESNPELEKNTKVQSIWEYYDTVQHKRRRCYIKYL